MSKGAIHVKSPKDRVAIVIGVALAFGLSCASCGGSHGGNGTTTSTMSVPSPPPPPPPSPGTGGISPASLPDAMLNASYQQTLTVPPATYPYIWTVSSGSLPPGLQLGSSTTTVQTISGVPIMAGTFAFTIKEACGTKTYFMSYTITVH
jgi:hypothetical protein